MKKIFILIAASSLLSNPINAGQENNDEVFPVELEEFHLKYIIYEELIGQELTRKIDQELTVEDANEIKEGSRVLKHLLSFKILFDAFTGRDIKLTQTPNAAKIIVEKLTRRLLSLNPREVLKFSDAQIIQKDFNGRQIDTLADLVSDQKQRIFDESSRRFEELLTTLALNYRENVNKPNNWYKKYNLKRKKPFFHQHLKAYDPERAPLREPIFQKALRMQNFTINGHRDKQMLFVYALLVVILPTLIIYSISSGTRVGFCTLLSGEEDRENHLLECCKYTHTTATVTGITGCCDHVTYDDCK